MGQRVQSHLNNFSNLQLATSLVSLAVLWGGFRVVVGNWGVGVLLFFGYLYLRSGARCSSLVRAFAHGVIGCRIDPSWGGPTELFSFQPVIHSWCNKGCGM